MRKTERRYRVNEIFCSLQGEGFYTGTASAFVRLSGCNRHCGFCDTDFTSFREMTAEEIVSEVSAFAARHLVLTGGEPLLQADHNLIIALKKAGFHVAVETNGTMPVPDGIDWVTCSPKMPPLAIDRIDELKVVFTGDDPEQIADSLPVAKHYFLQPLSCGNTAQVVAYIMSHPRWRLSLQTHKLIAIP